MKFATVLLATAPFALAESGRKCRPKQTACDAIKKKCEDSGFVLGKWSYGYGLWRNCINPIMQGKPNGPNAIYELPSVDPKLISDCKAKVPGFGAGEVGSAGAQFLSCYQVRKDCIDGGFVYGQWEKGYGLWRNCINPTIQDMENGPNATKSLPCIDEAVVLQCIKDNPKFGRGPVGSSKI
jgi:hypothetical protein